MKESDDLIDALAPVVEALKKLEIRHYVGGSVASSFHGATRTTMDVDLLCELTDEKVSPFVGSFDRDFYVSEPAVRDAISQKSCCSLIHLPSSFKVDLFISRGRPFDLAAMQRARPERLGENRTVIVPIATAEDSIISKLEWYRLTNESSERQWDDVSRLIRLLGDEADRRYLQESAESVGVSDLLSRVLSQH